MTPTIEEPLQKDGKGYSLRVDKDLFLKIEKHVKMYNLLSDEKDISKRKWISSAVSEQLAEPSENDIILKEEEKRVLLVVFSAEMEEAVNERVNLLKKRGKSSIRHFVVQSVKRKLLKESSANLKSLEKVVREMANED